MDCDGHTGPDRCQLGSLDALNDVLQEHVVGGVREAILNVEQEECGEVDFKSAVLY